MATYIALIDFTDQGVDTVHETTRRAEAFRRLARKQGAKVREVYWTLGAHDGVLIFDAPDPDVAASMLIGLARGGNVRSQTLCAFGRDQMEAILAKVS